MGKERVSKRKKIQADGMFNPRTVSPRSMGVLDDLSLLQEMAGNEAVRHVLSQSMQIKRMPNMHKWGNPEADIGLVKRMRVSLPDEVMMKMEDFFESDFSDVKIHEDSTARSIGALAFTRGDRIYLAPGKYQPHTLTGQELIGNALAFVLQQRKNRVRKTGYLHETPINQERRLEREAEELGKRAARYVPPRERHLPAEQKMTSLTRGNIGAEGKERAGRSNRQRRKGHFFDLHSLGEMTADVFNSEAADKPGYTTGDEDQFIGENGQRAEESRSPSAISLLPVASMANNFYRKIRNMRGANRKKSALKLYRMAVGTGADAAQAQQYLLALGILKRNKKAPALYTMEELKKDETNAVLAIIEKLKSKSVRR